MKPKIIISIAEGIITNVSSTEEIDLIFIDYDFEDSPAVMEMEQDNLFKLGEAYKIMDNWKPLNEEEKLVQEELKNRGI